MDGVLDIDAALAIGGLDAEIEFWEVATGKLRLSFRLQGQGCATAFAPDGSTIAVGTNQGVFVCETATGKMVRRFNLAVTSVAVAPDGKRLAVGTYNGPVKLFDLETGKELRACAGPDGRTRQVAFSPDGKLVAATGIFDHVIRFWDVATGQPVHAWGGHEALVTSVAVSPDGTLLASGSLEETIRLWDLTSGKEMRQLRMPGNPVTSVAFSPDGKTLVCGLNQSAVNKVVRLWEVATGKELRQLPDAPYEVTGLAFSPDGTTVAAGSYDKTIRLWNLATSKTLAAGSLDRTVRLWEGEPHTSRMGCPALTGRAMPSIPVMWDSGSTPRA